MSKMGILRDRSEKTNTTKILEQMPEKINMHKMKILREITEKNDTSGQILQQTPEKTDALGQILQQTPEKTNAWDKVYVINLDRSQARMEKMNEELTGSGVEYKRFPAVNGYQILIEDIISGDKFTGKNLKDNTVKIDKNIKYKITCDPENESPSFFYFQGKRASAGEFGIWCSNILVWKDALANNYNNIVVFEDDAKVLDHKSFKFKLNNFVENLPDSYDIGYVYLCQHHGKQIPIPNNKFVNNVTDNFLSTVIPTMVYSTKGMEKLLSYDLVTKEIDLFFWDKKQVISSDGSQSFERIVEPYVSSEQMIGINSFESSITEMGRNL